ncbi:MAG: threonine synthase [Actinomycetota bacterium]|nr:threonine synthase [Actinomycetota bacterium]
MAYIKGLRCRECGREYPIEPVHVCEFCFGPLEVVYDYEAIAAVVSREKITSGPPTIWRYAELLPCSPGAERVDLGSGFTPLVKADNLGKALGLKRLYLKNDTLNPTYSFKDRVVSVALTRAKEFGFNIVACASTGNLANSVAAHAAKAGMAAYVFIPADLEKGKVLTTAVYGPNLVAVDGNYDEVNRLCAEIAGEYPWAFVNVNIRPYYAEGSKTIAFETAEQLDWRAPDHVVVPIASGSLLTKIKKGFNEMIKVGLIEARSTKISGAQALGCAPVATAFEAGVDIIKPVKPKTIAKSLAIGNPADGYYALKAVNETGGAITTADDDEIVEAIKLLAENEGIFTETAGGVTVAVLKKLVESGKIKPDELTVAYITGLGLKTLEALEGKVGPKATISANLDDFQQAFGL